MELKIHFIEDGELPTPHCEVLVWTNGKDLPTIGYKASNDPESHLWFDTVHRDWDGCEDDMYDVVCWMYLPEKPKRVGW